LTARKRPPGATTIDARPSSETLRLTVATSNAGGFAPPWAARTNVVSAISAPAIAARPVVTSPSGHQTPTARF